MNSSQCSIFHELSRSRAYHVLTVVRGVLCTSGAIRLSMQWSQYVINFILSAMKLCLSGSSISCSRKHESTLPFLLHVEYHYFIDIRDAPDFRNFSVRYRTLRSKISCRLRYDCFLLDFRVILLTRFQCTIFVTVA